MDNLTYLFMAYTIIWIALFAYLSGLHRGQRRLRREIESLRELARERDEANPAAAGLQVGARRLE